VAPHGEIRPAVGGVRTCLAGVRRPAGAVQGAEWGGGTVGRRGQVKNLADGVQSEVKQAELADAIKAIIGN
jgi:hypothetical protein